MPKPLHPTAENSTITTRDTTRSLTRTIFRPELSRPELSSRTGAWGEQQQALRQEEVDQSMRQAGVAGENTRWRTLTTPSRVCIYYQTLPQLMDELRLDVSQFAGGRLKHFFPCLGRANFRRRDITVS